MGYVNCIKKINRVFRVKLTLALGMTISVSCDSLSPEKDSDSSQKATIDELHKNGLFASDKTVTRIPMDSPCGREKSAFEFANAVIQTMFGRDMNEFEKSAITEESFNREQFVNQVLTMPESDHGISRFISNLFLLSNLKVNMDLDDEERLKDATLVGQLKQEPIQLVLRNKDKAWPWFFTTREIFCTEETSLLYDFTIVDTVGFTSCEMPEDRAGFLGLASVLRAIPSDFISVNNNYKRVSFALYLAKGMKLLAKTNGPKGEGPGLPLPECVPLTDMRQTPDGLSFGTARIPIEGSVCASCHSPYNGPMSVAFRRFKEDGSRYTLEDIERINRNQLNGASVDLLQNLLNETQSCWSADGKTPPRKFNGLPGLARLIVESDTLGKALGIQVPQLLGNREPVPNISSSVEYYYEESGQMLTGAFKGYLMSDTFQCSD